MKQFKQNRKAWYRFVKSLTRGRYKRPEFIFLGEEVTNGAIILSNHEGTDAPMSLEHYAQFPVKFWGASEMNSGLIELYKYQTKVYYHQKKHWNLWLARLFCLIASPLTNMFYKGLQLISTYKDRRFLLTIRKSIEAINKGENIVIFPERSDNGYLEQLEGFYAGFVLLAEALYKKGVDIDIYTAYFKKKELKYIFDKPIKYSQLKALYSDKQSIAQALLENCNALGQLALEETQLAA